jgi:flagellar hook-basal body complex protein FliE
MKIDGINSLESINPIIKKEENKNEEMGFKEFLDNAINKVDSLQKKSNESDMLFISGQADNLHQVMIDGSKAEIALQLTVQIRNKIMDAYNEIMRMQL